MKKLIMLLAFISFGIIASAQGPWSGFLKPASTVISLPKAIGLDSTPVSVWKFRPTVELSAIQLVWNKTTKSFDATSLQSAGFGIGYQHFINVDGKPYNDYGFNALVLFGIVPTETTNASISGAVTVSAFQFLNVGGGYDFGNKVPFLLTGVTVRF